MTKILVLGASGMLGHKILLALNGRFQVYGTLRKKNATVMDMFNLMGERLIENVSADRFETVQAAITQVKPDVVINCIGIVKQLKEASDPVSSILVNALFPHQLAAFAQQQGFRLIHFSTDCVFSGAKGPYAEESFSDATDLYGRTKYLGEVTGAGCLTLRTSIVGQEIINPTGLFSWFLSQKGGRISGYKNALFTGLTTNAVADLLAKIITDYSDLSGLYHLSADAISKYDLLQILNNASGKQVTIDLNTDFHCDRRLDSQRLRAITGWKPASWTDMIAEMFTQDAVYYNKREGEKYAS